MRSIGLGVIMVLCNTLAFAVDLQITVTDSAGTPLEHSVVSLHTDVAQRVSGNAVAIMDQQERQFSPTVLPIQLGSQVSFPNSDDVRHHVYSFSAPNQFELKLYHGEAAEPVRFDHSGIVALGCNIHDGMVGYLVVVDTPLYASSDKTGVANVANVPAGQYTLQVWHPDMGIRYERRELVIRGQGVTHTIALKTGAVERPEREISPLQALFRD